MGRNTEPQECEITKLDLTPTLEQNTIGSMPAGLSVTKDQLERDLYRLDQEISQVASQIDALQVRLEDLSKQRDIINGAIEMYFRPASEAAAMPAQSKLDHMSIAEACRAIFDELNNRWLSLSDLDTELRRHGKICSKGSIEVMLKAAGNTFQVERRGKRNFYRMTAKEVAKNDVGDSHSRTTKR